MTKPTEPIKSPTVASCAVLSFAQFMKAFQQNAYASLSMVTLSCAEIANSGAAVPKALPDAMTALLEDFSDVFGEPPASLPPVRGGVSHAIPLMENAEPPFKPMYRLSKPESLAVQEELTALLSKGSMEPSMSPFGSPILFVHKKDGSLRMVIDYRAVNQITVKGCYPIPNIDDLLNQLQGARYFSSLDLRCRYHQIRVSKEDSPKTAFRTPQGLFQFRMLPFALLTPLPHFRR